MPEAYRQAIFDSLYRAMRETCNVPEDDQFMTIREHDAANFRYGVLSWHRSERRSRADPDHREQHPHRGTEESAVPADREAARRKPRHPAGGRVRPRPSRNTLDAMRCS